MAFKLDQGIFSGLGAGQLLGVLNSPALITVDKEGGQGAATISVENVKKMLARLWPYSIERAVWTCNSNTLPQLLGAQGIRELMTFANPDAPVGAPRMALAGVPLQCLEAAKTLGTVGDLVLLDPSEYIVSDKGGLQQTVSMDVKFLSRETAFRFVLRVDGQPVWAQPVTPYNGSETQSPYVALATRA
jgi:HK97 family phage major capsid protein